MTVRRFVPFAIDIQAERTLGEINLGDRSVYIFGAEMLGLLLHVLDEIWPIDPFRKAGEILDKRRDGKLTARLMSADNKRLEVCPSGIDGRSVSGTAGADDHNVSHGRQRTNFLC